MRVATTCFAVLFLLACDPDPDPDSDAGGADAGVATDGGADGGGADGGDPTDGGTDSGTIACSAQDVGAWGVAQSLPAQRESTGALIAGGMLHVFGGWTGAGGSDTSWRAPIAADGSLGAFITGEPLPLTLERGVPARIGDRVFLMGGDDGVSSVLADVHVASLGADGALTGWMATTPMPGPRLEHAVISRGSDFVVFGGASMITGGPTATVFVGTPGASDITWTTAEALPTPITSVRAAVVGDFVFVFGQGSPLYRAPLATLTGWTVVGPSPGPGQMIGVGDDLLSAGGFMASTAFDTVRRAPIGADGSVGTWVGLPDLPTARFGHRLVATATHAYAVGGWLAFGTLHDDVLGVSLCP